MANTPYRHRNNLIVLIGGLPLLAVIFALGVDKHLSADGANYFTRVLETRGFTYIDWSRQFASYISQSLLVVAVNLGVVSLPVLRAVFGASMFVPWLLAFSLSLYALRREDKSVLLFFFFSMVCVNLTSDFILVGEHHVMALLCWPVLFLLMRKPAHRLSDIILMVALLSIFTRLYPTAIVPAALFLLVSLAQLFGPTTGKQKAVFLGTGILSVTVIAFASYSMLFPRNPGNMQQVYSAISQTLLIPEAMASISFLVFLVAGWFFKRNSISWLALLPVAGYVFYVVKTGHSLSAFQSFDNRTLSLTLLPLLMLAAIAVKWKKRTANNATIVVSTVFVMVFVAANIFSTLQWSQYRSQMQAVLKQENGFVKIEATHLYQAPQRWGWNNDQLSVIWSNGCVGTIIQNAEKVAWEPKGPPERFRLKNYSCYTAGFSRFDSELCTC